MAISCSGCFSLSICELDCSHAEESLSFAYTNSVLSLLLYFFKFIHYTCPMAFLAPTESALYVLDILSLKTCKN